MTSVLTRLMSSGYPALIATSGRDESVSRHPTYDLYSYGYCSVAVARRVADGRERDRVFVLV